MKPPRQLALAVLLWTAHDAAAAATLPIDGNYGDRGGCRFAAGYVFWKMGFNQRGIHASL